MNTVKKIQIFEGNIVTPADVNTLAYYRYMVVDNGVITELYESKDALPSKYEGISITSYGNNLIMPGFVDTHLHAPQYANMGLGCDKELLPWLETYTFPEESRYREMDYATQMYGYLIQDLVNVGTTSSIVFGSIYTDTTLKLMELLEKKGLRALVGKVNMDRNSPDFYIEDSKQSMLDTVNFIEKGEAFNRVKPIITPRFVPSCTPELMQKLGKLAEQYDLKVQSHLSENRSEIEWVASLHLECNSYLEVYERYGLLRGEFNTVMAHCVWSDIKEQELLKKYDVMVAHAPFSNGNLASGIAPIREMLDRGLSISLCSDISGGNELFMGRIIGQTALFGKMKMVYTEAKPLTTTNLFYLATKGGGRFFGNIGALETGYKADFLVVDDADLCIRDQIERTIEERLQRFFLNGGAQHITHVYVDGISIK